MSTIELSPIENVEQDHPSIERMELPEITMPGISDETRLVIGMLLLKGSITVPTNYLHGADKGAPEIISSAEDLNALVDRLGSQKGGQSRLDIVSHQLNRIAQDTLNQKAE